MGWEPGCFRREGSMYADGWSVLTPTLYRKAIILQSKINKDKTKQQSSCINMLCLYSSIFSFQRSCKTCTTYIQLTRGTIKFFSIYFLYIFALRKLIFQIYLYITTKFVGDYYKGFPLTNNDFTLKVYNFMKMK